MPNLRRWKLRRDKKDPIYPLPKDTSHIIKTFFREKKLPSNFGLLFSRLFYYYSNKWEDNGEDKASKWRTLAGDATPIFKQFYARLLPALWERGAWGSAWEALGFKVDTLRAKVVWRLTVGFGTASVRETGLSLHRIFGIPYIPGSAVKGLVRNWKLWKISQELGIPWGEEGERTPLTKLEELLVAKPLDELKTEKEKEALRRQFKELQEDHRLLENAQLKKFTLEEFQRKFEGFRRAFGSTSQKGEVIFFDAFPEPRGFGLDIDIINVHYKEYYTEKPPKPPADYHSPVPVYFLALRKGSVFRFPLACKDGGLLSEVKGWLKEAAEEFGVGAKTCSGYGELEEIR